jgi:hypothetical protein
MTLQPCFDSNVCSLIGFVGFTAMAKGSSTFSSRKSTDVVEEHFFG